MNGMSGKAKARLAGVLYVINVAGAIAAQGVISQRFIHLSDPAGTTSRIAANPGLYGLGFSLYMVEMIAQIGVALVFYELLKPVSRPLSRASLVFGLVGCVIKTFARAFYYAPLAFTGSPQAQSATAVLLAMNEQGAALALLFFGLQTVIKGWLMIHATYFPRFLGIISLIAGAGWLLFIWPPLGLQQSLPITLVGLLGVVATTSWLLIKGLDEQAFVAQSAGAR